MPTSSSSGSVSKKRVLLVDDHPIVRHGLMELINTTQEICVCGEASTGKEALDLLESASPDMAIVDISLEDRNGVELIRDILARRPELPCLVLSMYDETVYAIRVLRAGARGYIMKQEMPRKIIEAIRKVLDGNIYLSEKMSTRLLNRFVTTSMSEFSETPNLSPRELEVLTLIGRGQSTSEIADKLFLSVKTVAAHRERIKEKLGLENSIELLRYAMQFTQDQFASE
jgi:DNA-binding NarL/FixJ family response regulator